MDFNSYYCKIQSSLNYELERIFIIKEINAIEYSYLFISILHCDTALVSLHISF